MWGSPFLEEEILIYSPFRGRDTYIFPFPRPGIYEGTVLSYWHRAIYFIELPFRYPRRIREQMVFTFFKSLSSHLLFKLDVGFTAGDSVTSAGTFGRLVGLGLMALSDSI